MNQEAIQRKRRLERNADRRCRERSKRLAASLSYRDAYSVRVTCPVCGEVGQSTGRCAAGRMMLEGDAWYAIQHQDRCRARTYSWSTERLWAKVEIEVHEKVEECAVA
jgi:hypothetical protein